MSYRYFIFKMKEFLGDVYSGNILTNYRVVSLPRWQHMTEDAFPYIGSRQTDNMCK